MGHSGDMVEMAKSVATRVVQNKVVSGNASISERKLSLAGIKTVASQLPHTQNCFALLRE
jgi:hypothetical protein